MQPDGRFTFLLWIEQRRSGDYINVNNIVCGCELVAAHIFMWIHKI